jgi:hypothetical protein
MGRARSQLQAIVGSSYSFNAAVGSRRGVGEIVHAQRDQAEHEIALDRALKVFADRSAGHGYKMSATSFIEHAHRLAGGVLEDDARKALEADLREILAVHGVGEIAIAAGSDDDYGFGDPALKVLTEFFARPRPRTLDRRRNLQTRAAWSVLQCFSAPSEIAERSRLRLQPLAEALAGVIEGMSTELDGSRLCDTVLATLGKADASALNGFLRSWLQAFEHRLENGVADESECTALRALVGAHSQAQTAGAFAPIEQLLRR